MGIDLISLDPRGILPTRILAPLTRGDVFRNTRYAFVRPSGSPCG